MSERLLEFKDYFTRSGVPRQNLPRRLRLGGERRGKENRTSASKERATVYHCILPLSSAIHVAAIGSPRASGAT
ncbi:MAG TPA: hypothetical protein VGV06_21015 [Methylomirabilota bacterium]|nr:hypothetical protein [Methylomirabilota bacterium]